MNSFSDQISGSMGDLTHRCRGILKVVEVDESRSGEKESKLVMLLCVNLFHKFQIPDEKPARQRRNVVHSLCHSNSRLQVLLQ